MMKSLILAGGSGTRLFPLSRELYPKQFIKFNEESLFQKTVKRATIFSEPEEIYIVTNVKHRFMVREQLSEIEVEKANIIEEPASKNTLPAIYFGMLEITNNFGDCKVAVLPSDHIVEVNESYISAFEAAEKISDDYLVTFGIKPSRPHTGYGYIKPGMELSGGYRVDRFVEKPDFKTAERYVGEGYLWNSGMFFFDSRIFFEECKRHAPEIVEAFELGDTNQAYKAVPEISVDNGVMEKTSKAAVVPLNTYWNDLGSFDALYEIMEKDENGNAVRGNFIGIDSENNLVMTESLVTAIGLKDSVVIETRDAILVSPRSESQKVKEIVKILREKSDYRAESHTTVYRPWGSYTVLEEGDFYKIKRVSVKPGKRLSLQMHHHRSEHWIVVKGTAKVTMGEKEFLLRNGESTFVPAGVKHRLENPGLLPLEVIEVQIGEYLGEDDIVRFEDDFGREKD
jgi:mannose-1-phosphate guanylyltransferase/mannose-6-phosphate isomerase